MLLPCQRHQRDVRRGKSALVCLGVGLPVLGNEEGLERLCRTDRMGFGAVWRS